MFVYLLMSEYIGVCFGDSGSRLTCNDNGNNEYWIIGVISFVAGNRSTQMCRNKLTKPSVITNVYNYHRVRTLGSVCNNNRNHEYQVVGSLVLLQVTETPRCAEIRWQSPVYSQGFIAKGKVQQTGKHPETDCLRPMYLHYIWHMFWS